MRFSKLIILTLITIYNYSEIYCQNLDSIGIDNNYLLNKYESEILQKKFSETKYRNFDFTNKNIGFFYGPNGQHLYSKKYYFKNFGYSYLIVFDEMDKLNSGGIDAVVVTWSKIYRSKPTKKMLKRLKNRLISKSCPECL